MSRLTFSGLAASIVAAVAAMPTSALAYCASCYTPCTTCYRQVVAPAQYRQVYDNVMVAPERVYAQRVPARYATVYQTVVVPRTVMVAPERVYAHRVPAQYATVSRVEMVAPPRAYLVPSRPACPTCY
jgi:hypothetical protein